MSFMETLLATTSFDLSQRTSSGSFSQTALSFLSELEYRVRAFRLKHYTTIVSDLDRVHHQACFQSIVTHVIHNSPKTGKIENSIATNLNPKYYAVCLLR